MTYDMQHEKLIKEITILNDRLDTMSDDTAKHRRWLQDMLYNLDDDNVPQLKALSKLVSKNGNALSLFKQEVFETYATIESLVAFQGETATTLSSIIQVVNETSATTAILSRYTGAAGVIEISNLNDRIDVTKIYKYVMGDTAIYYYHDGTSWIAMANPPQSELISSITTVATDNEANIALVVGEDKLVGEDGKTNAASIVLSINEAASSVKVNADHISFAGKAFDLTAENISITSSKFSVTKDGVVSATGANISGDITMTGGSINWMGVGAPDYSNITGTKPPLNADNTASAVGARLTYIDAFGIYTGSLAAEQIITGNLSTDRIARNSYGHVVMPNTYLDGILAMGGTQALPAVQQYIDGNGALITKNTGGIGDITFYPYGVAPGMVASSSNYMRMFVQGYRVLTTLDAVFQ